MKRVTTLLSAAAIGLALAAISAPADAGGGYRGGHRGHWHGGHRHGHWHGHVGFGFGGWWPGYWGGWGPYWGGGYFGAPYYGGWSYPATTVVVPQEPRVYVEQGDAATGAHSNGNGQWWYWCASAKGYYPYVSSCTEGWQRVAPQPPQPVR